MARERFTDVYKFVHRFAVMQYLPRSAISNSFNSNFIAISRQKLYTFLLLNMLNAY